ncbi:hypothetical protein L7F22_030647 [Adiantum nelumboides]|nr:hypothetical protein [Adiantum nelumboides]
MGEMAMRTRPRKDLAASFHRLKRMVIDVKSARKSLVAHHSVVAKLVSVAFYSSSKAPLPCDHLHRDDPQEESFCLADWQFNPPQGPCPPTQPKDLQDAGIETQSSLPCSLPKTLENSYFSSLGLIAVKDSASLPTPPVTNGDIVSPSSSHQESDSNCSKLSRYPVFCYENHLDQTSNLGRSSTVPLKDRDLSLCPKISAATTKALQSAIGKGTSPSLKCIPHEKNAASSLAKKLSPSPKLKKPSPSKSISKALRLVRGRAARSLGDHAFLATDNTPAFLDANNTVGESEGPISASFHSQLSLVPSVRALSISELSDIITFRFAFEGKVLSTYGTYKVAKSNYARHMRVGLDDKDSRHTVTFMVNEIYLSEFVESFVVGDFIRVEGACVKRKVFRDGGTCLWFLYANATTVVVKSKAFECYVQLFPKHRIRDLLSGESLSPEIVSTIAFIVVKVENSTKRDGSPSYRLTVADGPTHADRANLPFVPSRRVDYHYMVNEVKANGCYSCVARNVTVFKNLSNTLFVVDATILCPLPTSLETTFANHFSKQVSNLGFEKKVDFLYSFDIFNRA